MRRVSRNSTPFALSLLTLSLRLSPAHQGSSSSVHTGEGVVMSSQQRGKVLWKGSQCLVGGSAELRLYDYTVSFTSPNYSLELSLSASSVY